MTVNCVVFYDGGKQSQIFAEKNNAVVANTQAICSGNASGSGCCRGVRADLSLGKWSKTKTCPRVLSLVATLCRLFPAGLSTLGARSEIGRLRFANPMGNATPSPVW